MSDKKRDSQLNGNHRSCVHRTGPPSLWRLKYLLRNDMMISIRSVGIRSDPPAVTEFYFNGKPFNIIMRGNYG